MTTTTTTQPVAWAEIPVSDLGRAIPFYSAVTGQELTLDESGPNAMAFFAAAPGQPGAGGHLYEGTPAGNGAGPTVHLTIPGTVEDAAERLVGAGGTLVGPVVAIPAGRFQYATDLDGNSIGLFEQAG